jgi:hypothetical protein
MRNVAVKYERKRERGAAGCANIGTAGKSASIEYFATFAG